jgi:hypothetical protein
MPNIMFYANHEDGALIRAWINSEPDVAWIVKVNEQNKSYTWRAQATIDVLAEQSYHLWHIAAGPLTIPSGIRGVADAIVVNPFGGWEQTLAHDGATTPWFGGNLPGPYDLRFRVAGREHANSLARSEFSWLADRYNVVGKPANPVATRWWNRLRRFVASNSMAVGWPDDTSRLKAYVFPSAQTEVARGRLRDVNPS